MVAPVLNLSGSSDFDPLRVTDLIASEFTARPGFTVIPVNLTLANLARNGKAYVQSPEEATALADEFGADATVIVAVTEYSPYDPPAIGLIMQWYPGSRAAAAGEFDPVAASRSPRYESISDLAGPPFVQVQRVFNAADRALLDDAKEFGNRRDGGRSAYGWRKVTQSQELWVRYSASSLIRSMERVLQPGTDAGAPEEADDDDADAPIDAEQGSAPVRVSVQRRPRAGIAVGPGASGERPEQPAGLV